MKRHTHLSVTVGFLKLHCAVKDGTPMRYWYYIKLGSRWYPFDVRAVARAAGHDLPALDRTDAQENLYNVAKWCQGINAQDYIK